ncbi:hypothetical protein GCM10023088_38770 [Actinomadura verrucosospora]|uniref:hypothetical protein n=1 Tax=Actinomadura verrucosospora TaxID=46165 RepID=UPI0031EC4DB7
MTAPGMTPEKVADKLRVLAALAPLVAESPTAAKVCGELARELRPVMPTVMRALVFLALADTVATLTKPGGLLEDFLKGGPSTGSTTKTSDTE